MGEGVTNGLLLFRSHSVRRRGDEERRTAAAQKVQPLAIFGPRNLTRDAGAIGVNGEERVILRRAKRERVDSHFAGAIPLAAAGIVAGALQFEESGG